MAHFMQNDRGPLSPGQTVQVNKYQVQIERYLSKGGYAYVYLVRTAQPVHGTTHHVLKRIAVPNEGMLSEVKKEVDIMRILRGHPNIVQLIDAAWHRLPNGLYEVFILMEFCAGGGIIDMMNRRLRERLTEAEILQIFVDVCEGVAAMHNLRPPLLHRDLKVENILQSSDTLFKLCDFGSATPAAPRPPANAQEIRVLEADLNRHTTLQYRAPEMVDLYLRRPVDEKSDIWALGVLLYKLCYYTTPFEEHGPLAILNVQYKIPSYPVYSSAMNTLIASMLREHGAHRPSVFDLLDVVHRMRGTKSRFTYKRPQEKTAPPRPTELLPPNPLDSVVSYRPSSANAIVQPKNAGIQAREKVLEAIAPMRRGRPTAGSSSRTVSPEKAGGDSFFADEEASWKKAKGAQAVVRGHRSGLASPTAWGGKSDDVWAGPAPGSSKALEISDSRKPFRGGTQSPFGKGFGDSFDGMLGSSTAAAAASAAASSLPSTDKLLGASAPVIIPSRPSSNVTGGLASRPRDAFYGLGVSPSEKPPAPTLAEARRLRTGLATNSSGVDLLSGRLDVPASSQRPNLSPKPSSPSIPAKPSPSLSPQPQPVWKVASQPALSSRQDVSSLSVEERFPSLEDLDRALSPGSSTSATSAAASGSAGQVVGSPLLPPRPPQYSDSRPPLSSNSSHLALPRAANLDGVRSEQITGSVMRDKDRDHFDAPPIAPKPQRAHRPSLVRKHRSSAPPTALPSFPSAPSVSAPDHTPTAHELLGRSESRDWLTGDDDTDDVAARPVLRESPSKRASVMLRDPVLQSSPQEAITGTRAIESPSPVPFRARQQETGAGRHESGTKPLLRPKPTRVPKPLIPASPVPAPSRSEALTDNWSPVEPSASDSGGEDGGPEDVQGGRSVFAARQAKRHGRQSSVHELVDLWGGGVEKKSLLSPLPPSKSAPLQPPSANLTGKSRSKSPAVLELPASSPNMTDKPRSQSPGLLISPTPSASAKNPSPTSSSFARTRKLSSHAPVNLSTASNGSTLNIAKTRGRPQSMILSSVPTKAPAPTRTPTTPSTNSLATPPDPRAGRQQRRTSISDMVQKYEAMGGRPITPSTTKPVLAKVVSHGTASSVLSPRSVVGPTPMQVRSRSHANVAGLPSEEPFEPSPGLPISKSGGAGLPTIARPRSPAQQEKERERDRPASPEKPYQGVGKLIDQWQRKTEAEAPRVTTGKPGGPGGGSRAALGAGARRTGVVAGAGGAR
ncbi:hypothetical protein K488DRAFT_50509 [Vararia minispora EC-137]|uniref:Uncharacterized protein n=1 Tax=Vararia minispora EC-137 TaxID=1314806 RepID=A0ACB8QK82_9AGAM|nr:hypothetical protein K488DRAFT_50509 [Vararia minispora EC-137]